MTISATASSNAGFVGVRFILDGSNLGGELTSSPYSTSWNTLKFSNGSHILRAVARDAAGNRVTSAPLTVLVSNPAPRRSNDRLTTTFTLSDGGGIAFVTSDSIQPAVDANTVAASGALQIGYAGLQMDASPSALSGIAIIGVRTGGVLVSEASVPAVSTLSSGRVYASVNGRVNTGIAIANPNGEDAVISFNFTDMSGNDFGQGSFTLGANRQLTAFLDQAPFNGPASMEGTFTFHSSVPVGVVAVQSLTNERSDFLFTILPVVSLGVLNNDAIVLPHFADGGGWTTQVILTNPSDDPLSGTVEFLGGGSPSQSASILTMSVNGATNSAFDYLIPPRSAVHFVTGNSSDAMKFGSVRVTPGGGKPPFGTGSNAPVAVAIFSFKNRGVTVNEASVLGAPTSTAYRMFAETSGAITEPGSVESGVAIANPWQTPVTVRMELTQFDGSSVGPPSTLTIPALGQVAKFVNELFPSLPDNFRGFLKLTATSPIGATGVRGRYNERGDFLITTTAPRDEGQVLSDSEILFPHIVSGDMYYTEFIIFGQSGSGGMWFNSANGTLLPGGSVNPVR